MSLLTKNDPLGLDFIIDRIQRKLYDKLSNLWDVDIEAYPRCYVLEDQDGVRTVEHYVKNNEYSGNLIVSEMNKFFFTAEDILKRVNSYQFKTDFSLYFILDLKKIYPNNKNRCDAEVLADVVKALDSTPGINKEFKITTDYSDVFGSFFYDFDNIQPYYCFRIDIETQPFSIDKKC